MNEQNRQPATRLALVIGSGSVKCAAALGLWKALQREGIALDMVVGCSGGSLYAAGIALGDDVDRFLASTLELWTADVMSGYASNLRAAMTREVSYNERSGLIDDDTVWERLRATFAFYNAVHHAEIIQLWPDFGEDISSFDVDKIPHIIAMGEKAAEAHIPYLKRLLGSEEEVR